MPKLYKIRPLVFQERQYVRTDGPNCYEACTPFCYYTVWLRRHDKQWRWNYSSSGSGTGACDCESPEDGKAQAQAHYEAVLAEELEEVVFNLVEAKEDEGPDPEPIV